MPHAFIRTTANKILDIAVGYHPQTEDDEVIVRVERVMQRFSEATLPGAYLVEAIPLREY